MKDEGHATNRDDVSPAAKAQDTQKPSAKTVPHGRKNQKKHPWTADDHRKFVAGLEKFGLQDGLGHWGAETMSLYMGNRSVLQIKSHMQKFLSDRARGKVPCALLNEARAMLAPESAISFPSAHQLAEPISCWSTDLQGNTGGWPVSWLRTWGYHCASYNLFHKIHSAMTPRLLSTTLRIFRAIDKLESLAKAPWMDQHSLGTPPTPTNVCHDSMRCGLVNVRFLFGSGAVMGVDVNQFWTDLAGVHREEFVSRICRNDLGLSMSELRWFCKVMYNSRKPLLAMFSGKPANEIADDEPQYEALWSDVGRDSAKAQLVRLRVRPSINQGWLSVVNSVVVLSPEEYEAARAKVPGQCEGWLVPVVGPKSASELLDPALIAAEELKTMAASAEGRAQLDKLAEELDAHFAFVFDCCAQLGMGELAP